MYNYDRRIATKTDLREAAKEKEPPSNSAADAKKLDTKKLFDATVKLLKEKKLGPARAYLDELGTRKDNKKKIPAVSSYGISGSYATILQDRVDWINNQV